MKYSGLSRCSTARGDISGICLGGPTKVKACKYFLFTEPSLKVENKEHLFDFLLSTEGSLVEYNTRL